MTTSENRPAKFSGAARYVLDDELSKNRKYFHGIGNAALAER